MKVFKPPHTKVNCEMCSFRAFSWNHTLSYTRRDMRSKCLSIAFLLGWECGADTTGRTCPHLFCERWKMGEKNTRYVCVCMVPSAPLGQVWLKGS